MGKIILAASIILIALSTGGAFAAKLHPHSSAAAASRQPVDRFNAYDWAASANQPSTYRYHGGPKSNDTFDIR
jgi:hypothetical protein